MTTPAIARPTDERLTALERRLAVWRSLALGMASLLVMAGVLGFQRAAPGPLEGTSLTLLGARGSSVTLTLRPSGELEARFRQGAEAATNRPAVSSLVLVSPEGREVLRLGEPAARQLAP